jgi:hypothetical protein
MRGLATTIILLVTLGTGTPPAWGHPLGNFAIDHYSRLRVDRDTLVLRYVIDMAEIPTFQEMPFIDTDGDRTISAQERRRYLTEKAVELAAGLTATINGTPLRWRVESAHLTMAVTGPPTAGPTLPTVRILVELQAQVPAGSGGPYIARYDDKNFPERVGWKDIVIDPAEGVQLLTSSVPVGDAHVDPEPGPPGLVVPPQHVTAEFTFDLAADAGRASGWRRADGWHLPLGLTAAAGAVTLVMRVRGRWACRRSSLDCDATTSHAGRTTPVRSRRSTSR